jgi:hypothetical protein
MIYRSIIIKPRTEHRWTPILAGIGWLLVLIGIVAEMWR